MKHRGAGIEKYMCSIKI